MQDQLTSLAAVVLAAGKGTRMKSNLPKVLHPVCGTPMVGRVLKTLDKVGIDNFVVVLGGDLHLLESYLDTLNIRATLTIQTDRLGTGEAVACAGFGLADTTVPPYARGHTHRGEPIDCEYLLVCAGDTPALNADILKDFVTTCLQRKAELAVLAMDHPTPFGYGRILQDEVGQLLGIVEEKDATPEQKSITLCNSGVIFAQRKHLFELLAKLKPNNAQAEYYLTDCFELSRSAGKPALVYTTDDFSSFDGVNNRQQLAEIECRLQDQQKKKWMLEGISFRLPHTTYIEDSVQIGVDCDIGSQCSFLGSTVIGDACEIGSHVILKNVIIPSGSVIPPGTVQIKP